MDAFCGLGKRWDHRQFLKGFGTVKGHTQRLRWPDRNSAPNAEAIGSRSAADGEFVFLTTVRASKNEASHDCC